MTSTEKSRTKSKLDASISDEATSELEKDPATIQAEIFDTSKETYRNMFAQNPHLSTNADDKIDFLAKRKAVDKILGTRGSGGRLSPEAEDMARKLLTNLDTTGPNGVNMDGATRSSLITEIVRRYNSSLPPGVTHMVAPPDFIGLSAQLDAIRPEKHKALFMTAMRSQLTGDRPAEKA